MEVRTFQGVSKMTERKEQEIQGLSYMRFLQYKHITFSKMRMVCADVFCGSGSNNLPGYDEVIDGSPIRILNGHAKANNTERKFTFWFSDIRKAACEQLDKLIQEIKYNVKYYVKPVSASDAINILGEKLHKEKDIFLYLVLDPNGPKDFPKLEVEHLIRAFPRRLDIIPNISATTLNRCIGARNKAGMDFKGWLKEIPNFDEGFVSNLVSNGRSGWIRKPIQGDKQRWVIIPTFGVLPPKHDWKKQGFVKINSAEGKDAIQYYCGSYGN